MQHPEEVPDEGAAGSRVSDTHHHLSPEINLMQQPLLCREPPPEQHESCALRLDDMLEPHLQWLLTIGVTIRSYHGYCSPAFQSGNRGMRCL